MKVVVLTLVAATAISAQSQKPPAPRALGNTEAKSVELLSAVSTARGLPGGRVLVNDAIGRRVLLFESDLKTFTVVADTTPATGNAYSGRFAGLIPYKGDSSLFVDPQALSMLVIDPQGKIGRVMSVPRPNEAGALVAGQGGIPGFDSRGRLVYRAPPDMQRMMRAAARGPGGATRIETRTDGPPARGANGLPVGFQMPEFPDSQAVVRVELATRKIDTVGFVKVQKIRMSATTDTSGRTMMTSVTNPLPQVDDWAVLADGSIALIRGIDYHIDWTRADGSKASSERLPFEWRHLNDSAKVAFLDSSRVALEKVRENARKQMEANPGQPPRALMEAGAAMGGGPVMVFRMGAEGSARGGENSPRGRSEATAGAAMNFQMPPIKMVEPQELPDYAPPFNAGAARADMDGNVWIRTSINVNNSPIYDVINNEGKLVDRISLPPGRVIAGFGKGGIVYMGVREEQGVRLEQARRSQTALP